MSSKLGKSLMHTIEGGKSKEAKDEKVVEDAFTEADSSFDIVDTGKEEPTLGEVSTGLHESTLDESIETVSRKPEKVKKPKKPSNNKTGGIILGAAMLVSIVAIGIAVFSLFTQRASHSETVATYSSIEEAIGSLTTKTDEMTVDLSGAKKNIQSNQEKIALVEGVRLDVNAVQDAIQDLKKEMASLNSKLDKNTQGIDENKNSINKLSKDVESISNRPAPKVQSSKIAPAKKRVSYDPSMLEDATLASIDQWGTQSYVMLRNTSGEWIPLTSGDYYKGWRFIGSDGNEASFKRGSKTRRLVIQE